ncbi:FmdB family zinc ribbon protein [Candidatus Margulisiibacteriota bacterium]
MPHYDYKCSKCSYVFEVQQRITEEPLKHCPKCKGQIKRLINPAGIIFKGSGFHVTDYGKRPKSKVQSPKSSKTKDSKSSTKAASPPKSK